MRTTVTCPPVEIIIWQSRLDEDILRMGVTHATVGYYLREGKPPGAPRELDTDVVDIRARLTRQGRQ